MTGFCPICGEQWWAEGKTNCIHMAKEKPENAIPDDGSESEMFYLDCCERMPEDRVRREVELLPIQGYKLTLDSLRGIFRLACIFDVSVPMMLIRLLQVYPELKKRLAL